MGNITISAITFILPGILHFRIKKESSKISKAIDILSVVLGTAILIYTTVITIMDI